VRTGHRLRRRVMTAIAAVVLVVVGLVAYGWLTSGVHPLSAADALARFRAEVARDTSSATRSEPAAGVYSYIGAGSEALSLPPKSESEGPGIPGTVTHTQQDCWELRVDFSDSDWQSTTYCPRPAGLELSGRGGWMRWDFVGLAVSDTSTYRCSPPEMVLPADFQLRRPISFSCRGSNDRINTGPVTMTGTTQVLGLGTVLISGKPVSAVHVEEQIFFSGGQTGSQRSELWLSSQGMPLAVSWSNEIRTPSPFGTTTMTGQGTYRLRSLTPRT